MPIQIQMFPRSIRRTKGETTSKRVRLYIRGEWRMTIGAFLFLIIPHLGFQRVIRVTGFIEVENTRIFQRSVRRLDFVRIVCKCIAPFEVSPRGNSWIISRIARVKIRKLYRHVNNAEMTKRDLRKDRYLRDYPRGNFRNPRFPIRVVGNACENFTLIERNRAARTKRERRSSDR